MPDLSETFMMILREQIGLTPKEIDFALHHCQRTLGSLPVVLWRYGFISIDQLSDLLTNYHDQESSL